jgi:thioredoxin 2
MAGIRLDTAGVIVECPACGRPNRLPYATLGKTARCGHCKAAVPPPAEPVEVATTQAFDAATASSALPLVVDFWAPWCGPCKMMAPAFSQAAREFATRVRFAKVNTEEQQALAARYGIRSIPTLVLFEGGRERDRIAGALDAGRLASWLNQRLPLRAGA